ncbi:MAG: ZIP family metal transporter [Gemmatimonadaceae bacterium]
MIATPLGAALVAAVANVLGAVLVIWRRRWSATALDSLVALAAGFMISVALTEILPEAIRRGGQRAAVLALVGYLLVHFTQHSLAPHFHFGEETHEVSQIVGISALLGLLLHTFIDGVAIASGFAVSVGLGTLIWLAILLHKVPEGLAISSVFLAAGASRAKALYSAAALGAATIAGVLVTGMVRPLADAGLALSAGVTLYVAASNLVPEFQSKPGWRLPAAFFAGCGLYLAARSAVGGGR